MLRGRRTKHWMRTIYALRSLHALRRSLNAPAGERDYWQAGRSVAQIHEIKPAGGIVRELREAIGDWRRGAGSGKREEGKRGRADRKSTRLNSRHANISYA